MNPKQLWKLYQISRRIDMEKLKSRKLWATIIGSLVMSVGVQIGLTEDQCQWIATIVTGYIVGQGIADAKAAK